MADIIDTLMGILCQQNTVSQCQQFVSEYPDPIMQTIYFFFFPTVFVMMFIYLLSGKISDTIDESKKFRAIIGISIFAFIVLQGWYHYLLILSRMWFFSVIILGGLWAFLNMGLKRTGGGGGSSHQKSVFQRATGSVGGFLSKKAMSKFRDDEGSLSRRIETEMNQVNKMDENIKDYEKKGDNYAASNMRHMRSMKLQEIGHLVGELGEISSYEGTKIGRNKNINKFKNWINDKSKK